MAGTFDCVLGSGPAAVACAHELLDAGRTVVMVDPNRRLAPERQTLVEEFRRDPQIEFYVGRLRKLCSSLPPELHDRKLPFASAHVYQQVDQLLPLDLQNAVIFRSLASGGLSTVWGATVIPFAARSFRNWPITAEEMAPFYRRVAALMDVPRVHDDLETLYPNFGDAPPPPLSAQGSQLMSQLLNHKRRLNNAGIRFGRGRSAIGSRYAVNGQGCVACGLCMYGCPYQAIFNAEYVVDRLRSHRHFTHRAGWMAEKISETLSGIVVRLCQLDTGAREDLACERLFLGCGAITSLRLVADARQWFGHVFHLADTQIFSIPVFLAKRCRAGPVPRAFALSQVFLEVDDPTICDENIHLQVYGFNPFMVDILRARWGRLINAQLLQPLFDRMMIVMGYLPGQLSGKIAITIGPSETDGLPVATCVGQANPRSKPAVRQISRILLRHARDFGWLAALPLIEIPEPGASAHLAACLPMRAVPSLGETDPLGRPQGMQRVHVIDAAVFSDMPSEHLTYTIMANAARIARRSMAQGVP